MLLKRSIPWRGFQLIKPTNVSGSPNSCRAMFPGLFMIVSPALLLVRAKPLPILSRGNESLYHFGIDKVASELIQFRQPEVVAGEV